MRGFPRGVEVPGASRSAGRRRSGGLGPRPACAPRRAALLLLAAAALAGCGSGRSAPERVVLVTIDTLRADRVGAYGDLGAHTPTLDALAERGVRFEDAIAPTPLTLPSHASLMAARPPPGHGVRHNSVFKLDAGTPVLAERMQEAGYATAAFVGAFVLDARFGLDRGFETYDDRLSERRAAESPFAFAERRADAVVDAALEWMEDAPDRFFLWVHFYDPHASYDPPARFERRVSGDAYAGEIAFADAQLGRLLRHVGRRWPKGGLLVAVTSDHGESLGEHQEGTHSYTVYDATQRVPLLLAGPGLPSGRVVEEQVRLVDVAPTLLRAAGAAPLEASEGRSLLPLVRGEEEGSRLAYVETLATQLDMGWSPLLGIRTERYKYIRAPQPELYDLREDPDETRNLALVRPEKARALDERLGEALEGARPVERSREVDAGERERLESLGYVVPDRGAFGEDLGVVGGPNPRDHMQDVDRLKEARHAYADGDPERALELLERITRPGPQVEQTRALAALAAGEPERAVAAVERSLERGEAGERELVLLGTAYLHMERLEEAGAAFERAREQAPEAAEPRTGLAQVAVRQEDYALAERRLQEAEARAAQPEAVRVHRAVLRLHQGRPEEAEALLEGIGADFLAEPDRALLLAEAQRAAGRTEEGVALLARALESHSEHPRLLGTYAAMLESAGRFDEALESWRRLHSDAPGDPGSKNDLAWGLAVAGRELDRALALAREAARALDGDPTVLDTLATVHLARSEPAQALEVAERALADGASETLRPHLLYVRAAALEALGREAEARSALRALAAEPAELASPWKERAESLRKRVDPDASAARPAPRRSVAEAPPSGGASSRAAAGSARRAGPAR